MGRWGTFNLNVVYGNAWELADNPGRGADCQTIVRYTENIIRMVGCPGTAEVIVVWAKVPTPDHAEENPWPTPHVADPPQWHNQHRPPDPRKVRWLAGLVDWNDDPNNYEACLRFTHGGVTKYYAGGVGPKDDSQEVIRIFKSMSWVEFGTWQIKDTIYLY